MHSKRAQTWRKTLAHQPLSTLMDRTWLLKPSSTMLAISLSMVISRPSRHSMLNSEMEGTVNVCAEDRWEFRGLFRQQHGVYLCLCVCGL